VICSGGNWTGRRSIRANPTGVGGRCSACAPATRTLRRSIHKVGPARRGEHARGGVLLRHAKPRWRFFKPFHKESPAHRTLMFISTLCEDVCDWSRWAGKSQCLRTFVFHVVTLSLLLLLPCSAPHAQSRPASSQRVVIIDTDAVVATT